MAMVALNYSPYMAKKMVASNIIMIVVMIGFLF